MLSMSWSTMLPDLINMVRIIKLHKMNIPTTTDDRPYIEFRINKYGQIKLSASESYWGGKRGGFTSSDGTEGNTCLPKDLDSYLKAFKERKIARLNKKIRDIERLKARIEKINYVFTNE